jgi:hypothetical protein
MLRRQAVLACNRAGSVCLLLRRQASGARPHHPLRPLARALLLQVNSRSIGKLKGGTFLIAVMDMANHNCSSDHVIKYHSPKILTGQVGGGAGPQGGHHAWPGPRQSARRAPPAPPATASRPRAAPARVPRHSTPDPWRPCTPRPLPQAGFSLIAGHDVEVRTGPRASGPRPHVWRPQSTLLRSAVLGMHLQLGSGRCRHRRRPTPSPRPHCLPSSATAATATAHTRPLLQAGEEITISYANTLPPDMAFYHYGWARAQPSCSLPTRARLPQGCTRSMRPGPTAGRLARPRGPANSPCPPDPGARPQVPPQRDPGRAGGSVRLRPPPVERCAQGRAVQLHRHHGWVQGPGACPRALRIMVFCFSASSPGYRRRRRRRRCA